jgi:hypothetical protein
MPFRIACPKCQAVMTAPDKSAGKVANCPACQAPLRIPSAPEAPSEAMTVRPVGEPPPRRGSRRREGEDDRDDDRPSRKRGRPRGQFRCPYCGSEEIPLVKKKMSTAGWIVFVVLLLACFPLCLLGLLITEEHRSCYDCGMSVG